MLGVTDMGTEGSDATADDIFTVLWPLLKSGPGVGAAPVDVRGSTATSPSSEWRCPVLSASGLSEQERIGVFVRVFPDALNTLIAQGTAKHDLVLRLVDKLSLSIAEATSSSEAVAQLRPGDGEAWLVAGKVCDCLMVLGDVPRMRNPTVNLRTLSEHGHRIGRSVLDAVNADTSFWAPSLRE